MKKITNRVRTTTEPPYLVYGLSYKTIHDDSSYYDDHTEWFGIDEGLRDVVYDDWEQGKYWDSDKECELKYRTPSPNYNHKLTKKISKFSTYGFKDVITYSLSEQEYAEYMAVMGKLEI